MGDDAAITHTKGDKTDIVRLGNYPHISQDPRRPAYSGILGRMNGTHWGKGGGIFHDDKCCQGRGGTELFYDGVYYHFKPGHHAPSMILARGDKGGYAVEIIVTSDPPRSNNFQTIRDEAPIAWMHREKKWRPDDTDHPDGWTFGDELNVHRDQLYVPEAKWRV